MLKILEKIFMNIVVTTHWIMNTDCQYTSDITDGIKY